MDVGTPEPSKALSLRAPGIYPHSLSGSSRSPVPAGLNPTRQLSPPDKPLPSLPVATVNSRSPVRRSLIDCTERPLRRSLTPPDGGFPQDEDWPTIEPTKPGVTISSAPQENKTLAQPSLGESFIEGMRKLEIEEKRSEATRPELKVHFEEVVDIPAEEADVKSKPDRGHTSSLTFATAAASRPLSSSQLPKPRDSMLESLSRHADNPVVRQTKASALRARYSIGNKESGSGGKKSMADGQQVSLRDGAESFSTKTKQTSGVGPIRTHSRGRFGVTHRGSPYSHPTGATSQAKKLHRDHVDHSRKTLANISDISEIGDPHDDASDGRSGSPSTQKLRQSSIPLPGRIIRQSADVEAHSSASSSEPFVSLHIKNLSEAPQDSKCSTPCSLSGNDQTGQDVAAPDSHPCGKLLNVREMLTTPAPRDDVSVSDSDDTGASVHGYDSFGGFRVKRVRNTPKMGPTLRIMDSASRILLGIEDEAKNLGPRDCSVVLKQKTSAPDLRPPRPANGQVRRSSAILTRPVSFARGFTDRSAGQYKNADDLETQNLIGANNSTETVHRAELPGNGSTVEGLSFAASQTDTSVTEAASQVSSDRRSNANLNHGDWPCKDFATFNLCSDSVALPSQDSVIPVQAAVEPGKRPPSRTSNRSRPPTIVLRATPDMETAPFLFQDLEQEQAKQERFIQNVASRFDNDRPPATEAKPITIFPPRTSSRKPKPPPILVSPPENLPSVNFQAALPQKAHEIHPDTIQKPRNVKTFSQSISPHTDSSKARKMSHLLSHTPSSSSKKVFSNLRGRLFHKRSTESAADGNEGEAQVSSRLGLQGSIRRKPVAGSGNKTIVNPLLSPPGTQGLGLHSPMFMPTKGPHIVPHKHHNPFTSPTTPFTAGVTATPNLDMMPPSTSMSTAAGKPTSPTQSQSPETSSLTTATHLTHTLLDLARIESSPQRKANLIELSKCMVEVVSAARDAEKSMEKAKMEAARAEVSWLKVQKEVSCLQGVVKGLVGEPNFGK